MKEVYASKSTGYYWIDRVLNPGKPYLCLPTNEREHLTLPHLNECEFHIVRMGAEV
jgi:hypothetical protein